MIRSKNLEKMQKINYYILVFFMFFSPIIDVINSFIQRNSNISLSVGMIFKGVFLIYFFIFFIFKVKNNKYKKYFLIYLLILGIWGSLFFLNRFSQLTFANILSESINLFKVFYLIVILGLLYFYCLENKFDSEKIKKLFILSFIIYTVLLYIPFITNTSFYSYNEGDNGGFVGWFYSANEISVIMLLVLFLTIYQSFKNKKAYIAPILLCILITLQIGTKVTLLGLFSILVFYLLKSFVKKEWKNGIYLVFIIIFSLFISFNGFINDNINSLLDRGEEIKENNKVDNNNNKDKEDVESYSSSILNLLLSGRYNYFKDTLKIYNKSNVQTKILGLGYTNIKDINNVKIEKLIEIDFLDIFFHCGIVGFILFLFPLIFVFLSIIKKMVKEKIFNFDILACLFIIALTLGISSTAGHILTAPSVATFLVLYIILLIIYTNEYKNVRKGEKNAQKNY